jgi:hypothetical protein
VRRAVILGSDRREGFSRTQKKHWLDQAGPWEVRLGREGQGRRIRVQSRPHCERLDRPLLRANGRKTIDIPATPLMYGSRRPWSEQFRPRETKPVVSRGLSRGGILLGFYWNEHCSYTGML